MPSDADRKAGCKHYRTRERREPRYSETTGECTHTVPVTVGFCIGTMECDECKCGGDESKCDFYPEKRAKVETNIYDKEEVYPNCTVQVWSNSFTGEVSVGWWKNEEGEQ